MVAHGDPLVAIVSVFGAYDLAGRPLRVGGEDLVLAIVLTYHIEEVGKTIGIVVADVGTKECLCDGTRWIVLMKGVDEGLQNGDRNLRARGIVFSLPADQRMMLG